MIFAADNIVINRKISSMRYQYFNQVLIFLLALGVFFQTSFLLAPNRCQTKHYLFFTFLSSSVPVDVNVTITFVILSRLERGFSRSTAIVYQLQHNHLLWKPSVHLFHSMRRLRTLKGRSLHQEVIHACRRLSTIYDVYLNIRVSSKQTCSTHLLQKMINTSFFYF